VHSKKTEADCEKEHSCEIEFHEMILGGSDFSEILANRHM
jgi:hypothetical protein